jgi:hypothetical protein
MNITFHIERLILDGLPISSHDAPAVQAALEAELSHLFLEQASTLSPGVGTSVSSLQSGPVSLTHKARAGVIGNQIAMAIHTTLAASDILTASSKSSNVATPLSGPRRPASFSNSSRDFL